MPQFGSNSQLVTFVVQFTLLVLYIGVILWGNIVDGQDMLTIAYISKFVAGLFKRIKLECRLANLFLFIFHNACAPWCKFLETCIFLKLYLRFAVIHVRSRHYRHWVNIEFTTWVYWLAMIAFSFSHVVRFLLLDELNRLLTNAVSEQWNLLLNFLYFYWNLTCYFVSIYFCYVCVP